MIFLMQGGYMPIEPNQLGVYGPQTKEQYSVELVNRWNNLDLGQGIHWAAKTPAMDHPRKPRDAGLLVMALRFRHTT